MNADAAREHNGIIANPNCSTIIALMALAPLHRAFGLQRATVATYQAVSGAGAAGVTELEQQSRAVLAGEPAETSVFQHVIAFNLFSHDSEVGEDGYNEEERKLLLESRKIPAAPGCGSRHLRAGAGVQAHSEAMRRVRPGSYP